MYYLLNEDAQLRGWKLLPYAVRHEKTRNVEFLLREEFMLLYRCDGKHDLKEEELTQRERQFLQQLLSNGGVIPLQEEGCLKPHQEYVYYPVRYKESVHFSITGNCNYRCKHCFMSAPDATWGQPSFEEICHFIDEFAKAGIDKVSLTGGEPLIRKDFLDIVDYILDSGLVISTIFSNGKLVTEELLVELEKRKIFPTFQMSYDGMGWHDWLRGVEGAEKAVEEAFILCQKHHFPTTSAMCVHKGNVKVLRESVKRLADLGCRSLKVNITTPQGLWKSYPEYFLSQEEGYKAFLAYIPQYFEDGCPLNLMMEGFFQYDTATKQGSIPFVKGCKEEGFSKCLMCQEVRQTMYVSPNGGVLPCMSLAGTSIEDKFPSLRETSLQEILNDSYYMDCCNQRVSDYMKENEDCNSCPYRELCCGGCRAYAIGEKNTHYLAKDEWTCGFFKNGWHEKVAKVLNSLGDQG